MKEEIREAWLVSTLEASSAKDESEKWETEQSMLTNPHPGFPAVLLWGQNLRKVQHGHRNLDQFWDTCGERQGGSFSLENECGNEEAGVLVCAESDFHSQHGHKYVLSGRPHLCVAENNLCF